MYTQAYPTRGGKEPLATPCQPFLLIIEPFELIRIHKVVMETGEKTAGVQRCTKPIGKALPCHQQQPIMRTKLASMKHAF